MILLYALLFFAANATVYIYFNLRQQYGRYLKALTIVLGLALATHLFPNEYLLKFRYFAGLLMYSGGLAIFEISKERIINQFYGRFTPERPGSPQLNEFAVAMYRFFLKGMYVIILIFQVSSVSNPSFLD